MVDSIFQVIQIILSTISFINGAIWKEEASVCVTNICYQML